MTQHPAPSEVELKLETTPAASAALLASDLFGADGKDALLDAVYFDTPDQTLRRNDLSLRIRRENGSEVQTIKAGNAAAGLFSRSEWERSVLDDTPVADERTPIPDLLGSRFAELAPAFSVPVERRAFRLQRDDAEIEVAVDRGRVVAGEHTAQFCEVELELLHGSRDALFELARRIDAVAPVRIGVLTKAERGYRLLDSERGAVHAEKLRLDPGLDLPTAFAVIADACLRHFRVNEAILLEQPHPEAIHQARVALRRLRSAMTLFRPLLTGPERTELAARVRALAQVLGEARDLDVLSAQAEGAMRERLNEAREAAYAAVARTLEADEARRLPLDLTEWITHGAWRRDAAGQALRDLPLREFAATALTRLRRELRKQGRHLATIDTEARHEFRKDAKKMRYAVEFLAGLFTKDGEKRRRKQFVKALQRLQDDLGALNDRASAKERLAALDLAGTPDADALLARWRSGKLIRDAARARHALLDVRPFWR